MKLTDVVRRRVRVAIGVAIAAAVVLVPAAQAAQKAPNPGFELDCGGIPCGYTAIAPATISRDTSTFHSGTASLKLTMGGTNLTGDATSACVTGVLPGSVAAGYWYRANDAAISGMGLLMRFYASTDCTTGFITGFGPTAAATTVGVWLQRTPSTFTVPDNTNSMDLILTVDCQLACAGAAGNFDDLTVDVQNVLAVTVSALAATRTGRSVTIRWRTGSELDTLGFNVYRERVDGRRIRLNARLIPALSLTRGTFRGSYSYLDRRAPRRARLRYWLQAVDSSGHRTWHGPVTVRAT